MDATAQLFTEFDTNNDGVLSPSELQQGLEAQNFARQYNLNIQIVQQVLEHSGVSGDSLLQCVEFMAMKELRKQVEFIFKDYYAKNNDILATTQPAAEQLNMLQNVL